MKSWASVAVTTELSVGLLLVVVAWSTAAPVEDAADAEGEEESELFDATEPDDVFEQKEARLLESDDELGQDVLSRLHESLDFHEETLVDCAESVGVDGKERRAALKFRMLIGPSGEGVALRLDNHLPDEPEVAGCVKEHLEGAWVEGGDEAAGWVSFAVLFTDEVHPSEGDEAFSPGVHQRDEDDVRMFYADDELERDPGEHDDDVPDDGNYCMGSDIEETVLSSKQSLVPCFDQVWTAQDRTKQHQVEAIEVNFLIAPRYSVYRSAVVSSTLQDTEFEKCVATAVHHWEFAVPRGGLCDVLYQFVVGRGDGEAEVWNYMWLHVIEL